jgi:acyl-coenzyme A synthetase/AMP-(fatty) acid ligase
MPSSHYNRHFKNGHKIYHHVAYRYHTDVPHQEFVSWNFSKIVWLVFVVFIVLGIIWFTSAGAIY